MRQFGWLSKRTHGNDLFRELLDFFDCRTLSEWQSTYSSGVGAVAFRTSFAFEANEMATLVWLRSGEQQAMAMPMGEFNSTKFAQLLPKLKRLSVFKNPQSYLPRLQAACQSVGVIVTTARGPNGCRASGATWVTDQGNPVIHLSFRHRTDDHFWFTFFHEAAHIILHGGEHIDVDGTDPTPFGSEAQEAEANKFAEEVLLPPEAREALVMGGLTPKKIIAAARNARVTAGIVVGQLENAEAVRHGKFSFLKRRYKWGEDPYIPVLA